MSQSDSPTPKLTLEVLAHYVPIIHEGYESTDPAAIRRAQRATEELLEIGMPLIRSIARREWNRRQAWKSRVPLDDIVQEGVGGFLRGIRAYNVEGNQSSPTNYLGQWIHSDIRRNVEEMDHDFSIPHETIERHRKIRAIRSTLFNVLGREPTDAEIVKHHNGETIVNKLGTVKKTTKPRKPLNLKHVEEERAFASQTGALPPVEPNVSPSVENTINIPLDSLFSRVFRLMSIGDVQETVVRAKFGLPPYTEEQPLRTISDETGLSNYKITQIVNAFISEMGSRNSAFHLILATQGEDETEALGLGWIVDVLSKDTARQSTGTPRVLTGSTKGRSSFGEEGRSPTRYMITYTCAVHGLFMKGFVMRRNIDPSAECPECGSTSGRLGAE